MFRATKIAQILKDRKTKNSTICRKYLNTLYDGRDWWRIVEMLCCFSAQTCWGWLVVKVQKM